MQDDRWRGDSEPGCVGSVQEVCYCFAIGSHVGAVGIEEHAGHAFAFGHEAAAQFELAVLAMRAAERPIHIDAVGNDGHGKDAIAHGPDAIVVLGHAADGVSARVGGVIPGAVVVHGPVHELQMAVSAGAVNVEKVRQRELADTKLHAPYGHAGRQRKKPDSCSVVLLVSPMTW